ncbi:MAG: biopolymer transporter ExbD [Bdellovibrionales bacterium]|nr:biopolymer transporter ExbD [Bdellovibrionales bacterium]
MSLNSQFLGNRTFSRHLVSRQYQQKKRKKMIIAGLMLTSMVDMFSLLVIFLLQNFSASPELAVVAKGVKLPVSSTSREIKDAPVLSISEAGIYLDQKFVGLTEELLEQPSPLMEKLQGLRETWQKSHPNQNFPGEISVQADQAISSAVVSRVMGMLPSQAFGSIQLAVVGGGRG